ncbi:MAG TPA: alpha-glucan family phosphorylase [Acidisarcina sp.]|nr:alpha-glucan family phosphorylase [Acidisarcina sp.]
MHFSIRNGDHPSVDIPNTDNLVAYFSMEIAVTPGMPTYSGGLGVLAGDTLRSAADLGLSLAAVTLMHRKGYFRQHLDAAGVQTEENQPWNPEEVLIPEEPRVTVMVENRPVVVRAWRYDLEGVTGHSIPIYFLDTNLEENDSRDRALTDHLYGGDNDYRLGQEAILGIAGARILDALELTPAVYHMNEGHAALLTLPLLEQQLKGRDLTDANEQDVEAVRQRCVFTTHTPVPAGHDRFSREQAIRILGPDRAGVLERLGCYHDGLLNVTYIALRFSRFVNGVAMQHGKVSRQMFPNYTIDSITNGVHAITWTSSAMQALFDRSIPHWRTDNLFLRNAIAIPETEIAAAHAESKRVLFNTVADRTGSNFNPGIFTLGFARRAATYKRADLLFHDPERLLNIARHFGGLQILYSGKAHPHDEPGKAIIHHVFDVAARLNSEFLRIVYLENYGWELGAQLTSGVDLWLNTPQRPYEASGTSGMKAALNGVPSLSVLDGWWIEGCIEGFTGWAIEDRDTEQEEAASLYEKLEQKILPLYYEQPLQWQKVMRSSIALNGSFFNTNRMLQQYIQNAYYPDKGVACSAPVLEPVLAK